LHWEIGNMAVIVCYAKPRPAVSFDRKVHRLPDRGRDQGRHNVLVKTPAAMRQIVSGFARQPQGGKHASERVE
jgi:hypothetical protein